MEHGKPGVICAGMAAKACYRGWSAIWDVRLPSPGLPLIVGGGPPERIRTSGLPVRNRLLYPAELRAVTGAERSPLIRRMEHGTGARHGAAVPPPPTPGFSDDMFPSSPRSTTLGHRCAVNLPPCRSRE